MSGRLTVVGIGPGSVEQLTIAARAELGAAELLVGYAAYLSQIPVEVAGGRREAYALGDERPRARRAVAAAAAGERVALVSSGDAGIYGMAALALDEIAGMAGDAPDLVVLPGVTAASAAGALLGAPLAVDFACLSLSDLLLPRAELMAKIEALAGVDIVLVLYNPASASRREPWRAAVAAIQRLRPPTTPAAAVRRAFREGQEIRVTDVAGLSALEVDMETVVVVGSSRTRRHRDWLYSVREESRA
ncbi:MAG TPA: precorrin-3B C(17)-methyltransferase [Candidatus Nitrosotalea sp.]|nr:precorrin-3B C(17)-methyltransferase [Candidatus Nitrosotalea sp.]